MKIILLLFCLIFSGTLSLLNAQSGVINHPIHYDGWGDLRIGKSVVDLDEKMIWKVKPSQLRVAIRTVLETDSGYTLDRPVVDMVFNADSAQYSRCFGEQVLQTQLTFDSLKKLSALTIYFSPSSATNLTKNLSAQFKTPPLIPIEGKPNTFKKTWTNGEHKIMLFSQAKIDGIKMPICFIRFWKDAVNSPEGEVNVIRKLIISKNQLPKDITGIGPIKLGVKRNEIQKYLMPGTFFSYSDEITAKGEDVPLSEEVFDKNTYRVNTSLAQFNTYSGILIKQMELSFDLNGVLVDILVIFKDTPANKKTLTSALESKWGKTIGTVGIDEVTGEPNDRFFFVWEYTDSKILFMNFNNKGGDYNSEKVIYLNFSTNN
jgi:hypothetical protein